MTSRADRLAAEANAFAARWVACTPLRHVPDETEGPLGTDPTREDTASLSDDALLDAADALGAVQRALDALRLAVAGEVAHRARSRDGCVEGLPRRLGHRSATTLLAELWSLPVAEAARLVAVGEATRPAFDDLCRPLAVEFPAVARAVDQGEIPAAVAARIIARLSEATPRCARADRDVAERELVSRSAEFSLQEMDVLASALRDRLDADGAPPSEAQRRALRTWRMTSRPDDMMRVVWDMPAETAGLVKAGIDAIVGEQLRRDRETSGVVFVDESARRHFAEECADPERCNAEHLDCAFGADPRTIGQLRSDAAEQVFRHVATCDSAAGELPSITMIVRVDERDLVSGTGHATIDGVDGRLPITALRRLAAEAEIIPFVLDGRGEVLDVGRGRRLFTRAQRLALAERDGGCAAGGCPAPPAYTEAHHIEWWSRGGRTDLANGVLLCSFHHHRVHDGGWRIEMREGVPWFLPPPWLGRHARPRRGGRPRPAAPENRAQPDRTPERMPVVA